MSDETIRPDQIPGVPHPRDTARLFAQSDAESAFLTAFNSSRLHHGWLISGARGIGKATLAWRIARFLRTTPLPSDYGLFGAPPPAETLDVSPDHPVLALIQAGADSGLRAVTRSQNDQGRLRGEIVADDIRALNSFFHLSLPDGGARVVIVDSADEMNATAANALLKMLEEPPDNTVLLLISHQPSRLLPTIRSRCRSLRLSPLGPEDMTQALAQAGLSTNASETSLSELSGGSVGAAAQLLSLSGLDLYGDLINLFSTMPRLDRARALSLAEAAAGRGKEDRLDLTISLLNTALSRLARSGASGSPLPEAAPNEQQTFQRLAPTAQAARAWADTAAEVSARLAHGRAVNLDPAALLLDTLITLNDRASHTSR
jgi:DNA polymerase-3 subunit delta'